MLAFANSVCLLALSRSDDRHVPSLLLCARLIALCVAVLALDARRQHARTYLVYKKRPKHQGTGSTVVPRSSSFW